MLDLLEMLLARYGIQNLRYDGRMRSEMRDAALVAFRKTGGPRVILINIKCVANPFVFFFSKLF